jgi:hypothetical protein
MPFDPNLPLENTEVEAAEMRGQLNGLKEIIDAQPTVDSAQVDAVTPLPPGSAPAASVAKVDSTLHFTFGLPVSISSVVVDSVSSVGPSDPVSVSATVIGEVLHLSFSIPRGFDGAAGAAGEVSNATLAAEIAGTARNPSGVAPLNLTVSDPPTTAEVQAIANRLDELRAGLLR